jgi:hypothetical protein
MGPDMPLVEAACLDRRLRNLRLRRHVRTVIPSASDSR